MQNICNIMQLMHRTTLAANKRNYMQLLYIIIEYYWALGKLIHKWLNLNNTFS